MHTFSPEFLSLEQDAGTPVLILLDSAIKYGVIVRVICVIPSHTDHLIILAQLSFEVIAPIELDEAFFELSAVDAVFL